MTDAINREDVIRMAKESGFKACVGTTDKEGNYHPFVNALGKDIPIEWLERFAALAALRAQPDHSELARKLRALNPVGDSFQYVCDVTNAAADALEGKAIKAAAQDGLSIGVSTKTKSFSPTGYNPVPAQTDEGFGDICYEQAVDIVKTHNKASISLVQRKLFIGYNRAARLLEYMEKAGVVISNGNGTYRMPPAIGETME